MRAPGSPPSRAVSASVAALFAVVLLAGGEAHAQFANHSIGFDAGYLIIDKAVGVGNGGVIGIESTLYLEAHFDLYFRVLAGIHKEIVTGSNVVGLFPGIGVRYLLSEDTFRPYLGLSMSFMHFFGSDALPAAIFAASPMLGVEYFFDNNVCAGAQFEYQRMLALNGPDGNSFAIFARIAWSF